MKIEILGTGCAKCKKLEKAASEAAERIDEQIQIEKVKQISRIAEYGVMSTPALVIDGKVVSQGQLLTVDEITALLLVIHSGECSDKGCQGCSCS